MYKAYAITCCAENRSYYTVTSKPDIEQHARWQVYNLEKGLHPNAALQAAWTKHGPSAFRIDELGDLGDHPIVALAELAERPTAYNEPYPWDNLRYIAKLSVQGHEPESISEQLGIPLHAVLAIHYSPLRDFILWAPLIKPVAC